MSSGFYVLEYADYPDRPMRLSCRATIGEERRNLAGTKFVVEACHDGCECLDWIGENETRLTHEEALAITSTPEWNED